MSLARYSGIGNQEIHRNLHERPRSELYDGKISGSGNLNPLGSQPLIRNVIRSIVKKEYLVLSDFGIQCLHRVAGKGVVCRILLQQLRL